MRIEVIGAGNVGRALGGGWARAGHQVVYGVREPEAGKYADLAGEAEVDSVTKAAAGADVVVLATP